MYSMLCCSRLIAVKTNQLSTMFPTTSTTGLAVLGVSLVLRFIMTKG